MEPPFIQFFDRLTAVVGWVMPIFFLLLSSACAFLYFRELPLALRSQRWPSARGRVVRTERRERRGYNERLIYPEIEYEYEVGNTRYNSSKISFDNFGGFAQGIAALKKDDPVTAYYQPNRPQRACLSPGARAGNLLVLFIIVTLFATGAYQLLGHWPAH